MSLTVVFKLLHILTAFWFVGGVLGRAIVLRQASRANNPQTVQQLMQLTDIFEKRMVIPGSMAVLIVGIITAILGGWSLFGFLQGANTNWLLLSLVLYLTNIPLIIFVYNPRGKIFGDALQDALAQNVVTPQLRAAFHDRVVAAAHAYELVTIFVIVILMVTKPF